MNTDKRPSKKYTNMVTVDYESAIFLSIASYISLSHSEHQPQKRVKLDMSRVTRHRHEACCGKDKWRRFGCSNSNNQDYTQANRL